MTDKHDSPFTWSQVDEAVNEQYNGKPWVNVGWDDLANSLIGRRLASNAGSVDYDWDENAIAFSSGWDISDDNDCVIWNLQKPHGAKANSTLNMHFHYEQTDAVDKEFTIRYRIQDNSQAKTTTWTEVVVSTDTNNVFPYVSGTLNQICKIADIDWSNVNISSTVQFKMTRSDSVGWTVLVTFVDWHVAYDQDRWSRQEFEK